MAINDSDVKKFEDEFKEILFEKTGQIISQLNEILTNINKVGQSGKLKLDIPNIRNYS